MSSNPAAPHIESARFKLVRKVSISTGLPGSESEASSNMKRDASLLSEFRSGVTTKSPLLNSLAKRQQSSTRASLDSHPKCGPVDLWQDEGGR